MPEIFSGLASMPRSEMMNLVLKNGLPKIELGAICLEFCEGLLKVGYDLVSPFGLDHDVVHIGLNGSPDEVSETLEHTTLVCSPDVL